MVGLQILDLAMVVRIHLPQPKIVWERRNLPPFFCILIWVYGDELGGSPMDEKILAIHEHKGLLERGIDYFSRRWNSDRRLYADAIANSFGADSPIPRWYLLMMGDEIIGGCGLIANDFISRQDLTPWICALYVEEPYRHRGFGKALLEHARKEAGTLGYKKVYLCTDHQGYYEQYGWVHIANGYHLWGDASRIYEHHTIRDVVPLQFLGCPVLETDRLVLRPFRIEDADDVFEYARNPHVAQYLSWDAHQTKEDSLRFIDWAMEQVQQDALGQWAIILKQNHRVIGSIGFMQFDPPNSCGTLGYALAEPYWNQGLTTEALIGLLQFIFDEMELNRVEAVHFIENEASGRVMEKAGMRCEGVQRSRLFVKNRYWDIKQYAMVRSDWLSAKESVLD